MILHLRIFLFVSFLNCLSIALISCLPVDFPMSSNLAQYLVCLNGHIHSPFFLFSLSLSLSFFLHLAAVLAISMSVFWLCYNCPPVCRTACVPACLPACLSVCLYVSCLSVCHFVFLSPTISLPSYLSVCLPIYVFVLVFCSLVCLSAYMCLPACRTVSQSSCLLASLSV